jgi:hypothetical protein
MPSLQIQGDMLSAVMPWLLVLMAFMSMFQRLAPTTYLRMCAEARPSITATALHLAIRFFVFPLQYADVVNNVIVNPGANHSMLSGQSISLDTSGNVISEARRTISRIGLLF